METEKIKKFRGANTPNSLAGLVKAAGGTLGPKLNVLVDKQDRVVVIRIIAIFIAVLAAIASFYFSTTGAEFIYPSGYWISILFSLMTLALIAITAMNVLKGKMVYVPLAVEVICIVWALFMMPGAFGKDNIKAAAEKQVSEFYTKAGDTYYTDYQTLKASTDVAISKGKDVIALELARKDKKGVANHEGPVSEKATLVSKLKPGQAFTFPVSPADSAVPNFSSMPEANKWVEKKVSELNVEAAKWKVASQTLIMQAAGTKAEIDSALKIPGLIDVQIQNLTGLDNSVSQISGYKLKGEKFKAEKIKASDLNVDPSDYAIGGLIEFVILAMLFLLIRMHPAPVVMDELHNEAGIRGIEQLLADWGIAYTNLPTLNYQVLLNFIERLEADAALRTWVKDNSDLNAALDIHQRNPKALNLLKVGGVTLVRINELLAQNLPNEGDIAKILALAPADWDKLTALMPANKAVLLLDNPVLITALLSTYNAAKLKFGTRVEDMNKFFARVIVDNITPEYLATLLVLIQKLTMDGLKVVTPNFVSVLDEQAANFVAAHIKQDKGFETLVGEWTSTDTDNVLALTANGIAGDVNFPKFVKIVYDLQGIKGLATASVAYEMAGREAELSSDNALAPEKQPKVVFNTGSMTGLIEAFKKKNKGVDEAGVTKLIEEVFTVETPAV